jgi:ABC-2 type transport system permease protein
MSAPAAPARRVLAQAAFETRTLLGNGEQLLVSVVLPILALVGLALTSVPDLSVGPWSGVDRLAVLTPGVLALAVISTAFTGQAILLAYERRYGVLRLLGTTPLGRDGLLLGKALAVLVVLAVQVVVIAAAAALLGWRPALTGLPPAVLLLVAGAAAFVGLAVLLGGSLRAEGVLALANLGWVLLLVLGGVVVPAAALPGSLEPVVTWLPSALLADGLRTVLTGVSDGIPWPLRAVALLGWAALLGWSASRVLRWSD